MSLVAYWCGYTWDISRNEVRHLQDLTTAYELDSYNSQYGATYKKQSISLKTTYRIETGTPDINWVIDAWKAGIGQSGPLYVGNKQFGSNRMQLTKVDVSNTIVDDYGRLRQVTISLNFTEAEIPKLVSSAGSGGNFKSSRVTASAADKASKKTLSIPLDVSAIKTNVLDKVSSVKNNIKSFFVGGE